MGKAAMQVKETALEYMQKFFPKLYAHLDTSTFELDNTNYVAKDFDEYYSDVVYRTYLKRESHKRKKHTNTEGVQSVELSTFAPSFHFN